MPASDKTHAFHFSFKFQMRLPWAMPHPVASTYQAEGPCSSNLSFAAAATGRFPRPWSLPSKKWAAKVVPCRRPSLGCLEITAIFRLPQKPLTAKAWSLPAARCWPAPAPRSPSGSESHTSTCSTSPTHSPSPAPHSAPKPRSPAACSSPG